jgi:GT2 family glycosyltransferase
VNGSGQQADPPHVTFVILNWNQAQMTMDCLESLYAQDYPRYQVIIVDNGSRDDSCRRITEAYPQVTIIANDRNVGYTSGNNIGIRQALQTGTDYVFLLNNDTTVDRTMLSQLVRVAEKDPKIGIVGPTMLYFDEPDTIWCAGNSVDWKTGETVRLRDGSPLSVIDNALSQDVDFLTSCAICIKRQVFECIGLMDERFFIYYDETDWFSRAHDDGWRSVYVPSARMWHKVSAAMGESSPRTDYYMVRNRLLFLAKHLNGATRVAALCRAGIKNARDIVVFTLKNHGGARLANRNAKLLGMRDAILSRWGEMRPDVEAQLYPN